MEKYCKVPYSTKVQNNQRQRQRKVNNRQTNLIILLFVTYISHELKHTNLLECSYSTLFKVTWFDLKVSGFNASV
jgi:hypothetical protein